MRTPRPKDHYEVVIMWGPLLLFLLFPHLVGWPELAQLFLIRFSLFPQTSVSKHPTYTTGGPIVSCLS